ncbi:MAG: hypothetical protein PWP32_1621 [Methanothermobacter sp.]|jgi:uncharacterized protein (UPF0305 family)|uniref:UPF0305 protein C7452_0568 n=2 Tax=Methanothermobacter TaxID=145260 RepID=A0A371NDN5_9EURY|nr:DUF2115 domain-containing protein [Methanothermobacter defluvii]MBC7110608.1 DUF2115 domain-containing protein [Methanothermobacter sp.]HIH65071.1 DUF2115 family protein [Methanothermobacter thermautotrophicus]MDK2874395.1 hypothetical protein [Methanothermobacter sp.]MDN5374856.1 hypothetical protein [Methanothermobacter sp.]REE28554.1 uncharacterized protein (UPF0305 family) [Methanothermobacter defluvii]
MIRSSDIPEKMTEMQLLEMLKKEASSVHIKDIMSASVYLREDARYLPPREQKEFIERFTRAFFNRIRDIKNDENIYPGHVDTARLKEFIDFLDQQLSQAKTENERCFQKIARIITIYVTFVRKEPVHPVGTRFPGGFTVRREGNVFYCPVKDRQINTPGALCRFCVSIQDPDIS